MQSSYCAGCKSLPRLLVSWALVCAALYRAGAANGCNRSGLHLASLQFASWRPPGQSQTHAFLKKARLQRKIESESHLMPFLKNAQMALDHSSCCMELQCGMTLLSGKVATLLLLVSHMLPSTLILCRIIPTAWAIRT